MWRAWMTAGMLMLAGCSDKDNAFEYFTKLDSTHERAVMNLRTVMLRDEHNRTHSVISVIYLDPVEPKLYRGQNYFLVGLYDRDKTPLSSYRVTLNGRAPAGIAELDANCSLRTLMPLNNPWTDYYEVVFPALKDTNLTITFETDRSLRGSATYRTDR